MLSSQLDRGEHAPQSPEWRTAAPLMTGLIRLFFRSKVANPWLVVVLLLFSGIFEGVGLSTMLPIFALVTDGGNSSSPINRLIADALALVGLVPNLATLLTIAVGGWEPLRIRVSC